MVALQCWQQLHTTHACEDTLPLNKAITLAGLVTPKLAHHAL
jgi:hypothetical protein